MAALLQSAFAGLTLRPTTRKQQFVSNGNAQKVAMKSKLTYQVEVRGQQTKLGWIYVEAFA